MRNPGFVFEWGLLEERSTQSLLNDFQIPMLLRRSGSAGPRSVHQTAGGRPQNFECRDQSEKPEHEPAFGWRFNRACPPTIPDAVQMIFAS